MPTKLLMPVDACCGSVNPAAAVLAVLMLAAAVLMPAAMVLMPAGLLMPAGFLMLLWLC